MVLAGATEVAIDMRPCVRADITDLREVLTASLPTSTHVAGVLEATDWSTEFIESRAHGVWIDGELRTVILLGQVLRVVTTSCEGLPIVANRLRHQIRQGTRAVMGPENLLCELHTSFPHSTLRHFELWERTATLTRTLASTHQRVRPPVPDELSGFARASFQAFGEELGFAPTDHPQNPDYLDLWNRARQRGLILGAWDENAHCIFRVEIRPSLGRVAELRGLWLDPDLRGVGLGRTLLEETVGYVTTNIAPRLHVIANTENSVATQLYRSAGFNAVARLARLEIQTVGG